MDRIQRRKARREERQELVGPSGRPLTEVRCFFCEKLLFRVVSVKQIRNTYTKCPRCHQLHPPTRRYG